MLFRPGFSILYSMFLLPEDSVEIRQTEKKGRGIFATKAILPGTVIGDYIGQIVKAVSEDEDGSDFYTMYYHNRANIEPDPRKPGIHFINHSCMPNIWIYTYYGHALYFALRHIFKGEELSTNYLIGTKHGCTDCIHACHCRTQVCKQTMHTEKSKYDAWQDVDETLSKLTKRVRIKFNQELPLLPSYPDTIADNAIYDMYGSAYVEPLVMPQKTLPEKDVLRELIRTTGRQLVFPKSNKHVLGVDNDLLITTDLDAIGSFALQ